MSCPGDWRSSLCCGCVKRREGERGKGREDDSTGRVSEGNKDSFCGYNCKLQRYITLSIITCCSLPRTLINTQV